MQMSPSHERSASVDAQYKTVYPTDSGTYLVQGLTDKVHSALYFLISHLYLTLFPLLILL
jgi:hypothetical protein